jgi:tRNA-dihydrouridine synthase C
VKLYLAPMEGVVDSVMRDFLTRIGGIDFCVTEFIRVTDKIVPEHVFLDYCPELKNRSHTAAGTPVFVQLLGGQVQPLAENAAFAASLGAYGIDLNFGCPARTVNNHDGGAVLLKNPDRLFNIVSAVRKAVPANIPVTAKMRLGYDDPSMCLANAQAVESAGAKWLTIHARTKMDAYRPPAHWQWIAKVKEQVKMHIIANGEVWNVADFKACQEQSQCQDVMIGRGAISDPFLMKRIKCAGVRTENETEIEHIQLKQILLDFFEINLRNVSPQFATARTKQWLSQIARQDDYWKQIFDSLKIESKPQEFELLLKSTLSQ